VGLGMVSAAAPLAGTRESVAGQAMAVWMTHRRDEVEPVWRGLEAKGIVSPGQSYDFIDLWVRHHRLRSDEQFYVVGMIEGRPAAVLPLWRTRSYGLKMLTWMPGDHVGANGPIVDADLLMGLNQDQRRTFWRRMTTPLFGADLLYLPAVPSRRGAEIGLDDAFERVEAADCLYRSRFANWPDCDAEQRDKRRRKIDRQQGAKLEALGEVGFEEVTSGPRAQELVDAMFMQKAARFTAQGIRNPFSEPITRSFYKNALMESGGLRGLLHVLTLDGRPVALRYNLVHRNTMFSLISSMSADCTIQSGSPGKQNLLRAMQSVFGGGIDTLDMGKGETDEKRLWCNEVIPLANYYRPLTALGRICIAGHMAKERAKGTIKGNTQLYGLARRARMVLGGGTSVN
jgi:CelD/BcsL family acetyltransferase involved in cellulose biosynthesis